MRSIAVIFSAVLIGAACGLGALNAGSHGIASSSAVVTLPQALDDLYPPTAQQPVYLFGMLKLDTSFSGIAVDLLEGDLEGAQASFKEFKAQYLELAKMVPEWQESYPLAPVEELEALLGNTDPGKAMAAYGEVGNICHGCHVATMVPVQQKYHWGNFSSIAVRDPLSNEVIDFSLFKKYLSANLAGISVNLRQGQVENARKQFQGLEARFQTLKETCYTCHDTEREYYVDENVQKMLGKLGAALASQTVSPEAAGALIQGIGRESCSKCHLVHVPAALARAAATPSK